MTEFYVSFEFLTMNYVAFVVAPEVPTRLHFASYQEFHATMDALGHSWMLQCETPHPHEYASEKAKVWEKQFAEVRVLTLVRPIVRLPGGIVEG